MRYAETHMRLENIGRAPLHAHMEQQPQRVIETEDTAQTADAPADDVARPVDNAKVDGKPLNSMGQAELETGGHAEQWRNTEQTAELRDATIMNGTRQGAEIRDETTSATGEETLEVPKRPEWLMEEANERTAATANVSRGESAAIRQRSAGVSGAEAIVEPGHMPEAINGPDEGWQPEEPARKPQKATQLKDSMRGKVSSVAPEVTLQNMKAIWPFGRRSLQEQLDAEDAELMADRRRAREMRIEMRR